MQQRRRCCGRWTVWGLLFGVAALVVAACAVALACEVGYQWEVYTSISGTVSITDPQADAYACVDQEVSFTAEAAGWADTDRRREPGQEWEEQPDSIKYVWDDSHDENSGDASDCE